MSTNDESYDAASVVARLASLIPDAPASEFVTPEQLVSHFCLTVLEPCSRSHGWQPLKGRPGTRRATGFCGFSGGRSDQLETGFDDGYDYMGYLDERGWRALDGIGDWPYNVWLFWPARDGQPTALAQYIEGDLTVWQFETLEDAQAFLGSLPDAA